MTTFSEQRKAERRKGDERRRGADLKKIPPKNRRVYQDRRKGYRRKSLSAFVTCRECGNLFMITRDDYHKTIYEGNPILCPRGCKKDNTKVAKTALFMVETVIKK